jgi:exopolysaccharide production protein ExoY
MIEPAYGRVERAHSPNKKTAPREVRRPSQTSGERSNPERATSKNTISNAVDGDAELTAVAYSAPSALPETLPESWRLHFRQTGVGERSLAYRACKRLLDAVGAVALALLFSPLIIAVTLALRRNGGPVIYKHRRVGRDGRIFECLKFRTMIPDADKVLHALLETDDALKAEWIQNHKLKDDPRVTRLGKFLRRTSLDELPQIWNVLKGDMSLVGPRPVVREELLRYGRNAGIYLSVKPGVTGLWQATGRNDTDYRRRVAMDVYYVKSQNLLLDVYILFRTIGVVLGGHGAY